MSIVLEHKTSGLRDSNHRCLIFETAAEQMAVIVPSLKKALARNRCCVYMAEHRAVERVGGVLASTGVNVSRESERGALFLLTLKDCYFRSGAFDPADMLAFLHQKKVEALAAGFSGLWVTGEMTWSLGPERGCDRMIEYEALLNNFFPDDRMLAICQYKRSCFAPDCIHQVLRTHPTVILGDQLCTNLYYEAPRMILGQQSPSEQVDWKISQLKWARAAERNIEENHAHLHAVVEGATDAFFIKDRQGRYLMTNSAGTRFLGKAADEVLGKDDAEILPAEVAGLIQEHDRWIIATGGTRTYKQDATVAGATRTFLCTIGPERDYEGNVAGIIGIARDITESKKLQDERDHLLERLRLQIDRLPLAYLLMDSDNRVLEWNPAAEKIFGYAKEEVLGRDCLDLIVPFAVKQQLREIICRIRAGEMQAHSINENVTKDGRIIACEWFNTPLMDSHGGFMGVISLAQDITERKRAEEALARDALLLANVRDSVIVTDLEGIVTYWNEGATRLFGWPAEEMLGRPIVERVPEPARAEIAAEIQAIDAGKDFAGEREDYHKDGSRVWIDSRVTRISGATGRPLGLLRVARDISDRTRAEEALREYAERLQVLSRRVVEIQEEERRHLARELHDEIGQALTAIGISLQAIMRSCGSALLPRIEESVGIVDNAIENVRRLSLDLRPSMLDDLGLVAALRWYLDRQAQRVGYKARFKSDLDERRVSPNVATASFRVAQEALTNVARHAQARRVFVSLRMRDGRLRMVVRDDGVGFNPDAILRRGTGGKGLGLLGIRERAALLEGCVAIRSTPSRGTRIELTVPLTRSDEGA